MSFKYVNPIIHWYGYFTNEECDLVQSSISSLNYGERITLPRPEGSPILCTAFSVRCGNCQSTWKEWLVSRDRYESDVVNNQVNSKPSCGFCHPNLHYLTQEGLADIVKGLVRRIKDLPRESLRDLTRAIAEVDATELAVAADLALQEGKVTGDQLRHPRDAALVDEIAGILAKTTSKGNSYLPNGRVTGNLSYESHQWLLTQAKLRKAGHDKDESS